MGEDMFIMHRIERWELANVNHVAMRTYNKMNASFRVQVEWGIGELKRKWKHLMKRFDSTKPKYAYLFWATIFLTNFLHGIHMDLTYEFVGDQIVNVIAHGWVGDF